MFKIFTGESENFFVNGAANMPGFRTSVKEVENILFRENSELTTQVANWAS